MVELEYYKEVPYAVMADAFLVARFSVESDARDYIEREGGTFVDTTPKPKIPETAEFVYWAHGATDYYARNVGLGYWLDDSGDEYTLGQLNSRVDDTEVIVLKRADDLP